MDFLNTAIIQKLILRTLVFIHKWSFNLVFVSIFFYKTYKNNRRNPVRYYKYILGDFYRSLEIRKSLLQKYFRSWLRDELVELDLDKYYREFCAASFYPDQVKTRNNPKYNNKDSSPLLLVCTLKIKENQLHFDQLHEVVRTRFVELLPSVTLTYFSRSSKTVYYDCLDSRGLEFSYFNYHPERGEEICLSENGRMIGTRRELTARNPQMLQYVLCRDTFRFNGDDEDCIFTMECHKTYSQLILVFECDVFNEWLFPTLECVFHDKVTSIKLFIHFQYMSDHKNLEPPRLDTLLTFLRKCQKVVKIGLCFQRVSFCSFSRFLDEVPVKLFCLKPGGSNGRTRRGAYTFEQIMSENRYAEHTFAQISSALEEWAKTRPDLQYFRLTYNKLNFLLHDGKLKLMQKLMIPVWHLTKEYKADEVPAKNKSESVSHAFWNCLESPHFFKPHLFDQHVM